MRWRAPSERAQMILLSPIIIPTVILLVPALWLSDVWRRFYDLIAPSKEYHRWFAWRPVQHYNNKDWLWLEHVERRWSGRGGGCFYRFCEDERHD